MITLLYNFFVMNTDIIQGNWERAKGNMKATWADLTDDEIAQTE
jgi:uncharacterized protein YjbJ (UPF0337 family)